MVIQSSSVFTSALTPLLGVGVLTIERMYPLTLGANLGTTFTAILAAFTASDLAALNRSLQVALCHLFFNLSGILIWYPIPSMRKVPIFMAKKLGKTTEKYKWFAGLYLLVSFVALPAFLFSLSIAGWEYLVGFGVPLLCIIIVIVIINVIQRKAPQFLPVKLRTWDFLPKPLHSLDPLDKLLMRMAGCYKNRCHACRQSDKGDSGPETKQTSDTKL